MAPARKTAAQKAAEEEKGSQSTISTPAVDPLADLSEEDRQKVADATSGEPPVNAGKGKYNLQSSRTDKDRPFVTSDKFSVAQVETRGREDVAIATVNHVGPANLVIRREELDELIEVLTALNKAKGPKFEDED
jgi:hypothetical protein